MSALPTLLAMLVLAQSPAPEPSASPTGNELVVASDTSCPSAEAVRQALTSLRPSDPWPAGVVVIQAGDESLSIDLGAHGTRHRQLTVGADCSARAMAAALVIATWMDDLPAQGTAAPVLGAPEQETDDEDDEDDEDELAPAPPPPPLRRSAHHEIGVALSTAVPGGWIPGGFAELIRMQGDRLGGQASLGVGAPREIWVGNGFTHWMRTTAGLALHARHTWRVPFVAADLGLAGAYTSAWGTGYATNRTDHSFTWGPVAGARAGIVWGRFLLWTDLRGWRWSQRESVQVDSTASSASTSASLPTWEGRWSIGVSYGLP